MLIMNGRFLTQPLTGVQRFAKEITFELSQLRGDVKIIAPSTALGEYNIDAEVHNLQLPELKGHFWEQFYLRFFGQESDIIIGIGGTGPIVSKRKQIIFIYDVNYILGKDAFSWKFRTWYKVIQGWLAKNAVICTISEWSAFEISKAFNIDASSIHIIPCSGDHMNKIEASNSKIIQQKLNERPFLLCVGSENPNKNLAGVIDAYNSINNAKFDLVIVGGSYKMFSSERSSPDGAGIYRLGYVTDQELKGLYMAASGYIMASFFEGFGIPAIEAMNMGCPVIVSNQSALPEVCEGAAIYCDPYSPESIAASMMHLFSSTDIQAEFRARGLEHGQKYSWKNSALNFHNIINRIL